jgi:hypothetical protein
MNNKEKSCSVCGASPPKNPYRGVDSRCRECHKAKIRENRTARIDHYREYDRRRGSRRTSEDTRVYRNENPAKYKAQMAVGNAVRDGRLEKADRCEQCNSDDSLHGHHDDYAKPLNVRWLCAACHHQWHAANGEAKNGTLVLGS